MQSFRYVYGLLILLSLLSVAAAGASGAEPGAAAGDDMGTLVTAEWLSAHLGDPNLVVIDCTVSMMPKEGGGMETESGRSVYDAGHIPTAVFVDLEADLSDLESPLDFALSTPERFCQVMGSLGVGDDSRVVLYDGFNSVWAARVWWMFRWVGFDRVALLDGGLRAWTAEDRKLSTGPVDHDARRLTPGTRPRLIAYRDEVLAAIGDDSIALIDAMPEAHFAGQMNMYGRPGHIPTARNISAMALFEESGRFRPLDELAALCEGDREDRVITYCGAGVAASATAYVLVRLGYTDVAVYMASLQEWAADPANPLAVDAPTQ